METNDNKCHGERCSAINGVGHSRECIIEAGKHQGWTPSESDFEKCGPSVGYDDVRDMKSRTVSAPDPRPTNQCDCSAAGETCKNKQPSDLFGGGNAGAPVSHRDMTIRLNLAISHNRAEAERLADMSAEAQIESEIQAKGRTDPSVTPADIEENIASEYYFTAGNGAWAAREVVHRDHVDSLNLLTFCVLVLRNGFTVTGESACAIPANFDSEIGRKIARENAINKVWPLIGYALKSRLAGIES